MKALCYERYGDIGRLQFTKRPRLDPKAGDVVVRVAAVALNPIDWKLREGQMRWIHPLRFPVVPCFDFYGTVSRCGGDVEDFAPGERVCGMSDKRAGGALATKCVCSADALAKVPDALSHEEAAGLPLAGLTALQGLRDHGRMAPGARVLVVGASGGVGHLATQIAAQDGAAVTAVCGPDNVEWVGGLGAETVLNYRESGWLSKAGRFDLIFDAVGSLGFSRCRRHLERGGTYVTTLPGPRVLFDSLLRAPLSGRRAKTFLVKPSNTDLRKLLAMQSAGKLRLRIDSVFDWKNYAEAFARSESGRAKGKIVLRIARDDG
ncbi:MAG: NAD(P)-dependent alcohol dehydrogenase [Opitutales bacterium]|nr:NAD(P)-dependent alcohol dehydrogenase [Opitutales bacterium]